VSRRPVLCDHCGAEIATATAAIVRLRFDHAELLIEAGVTHRWCSGARPRAPHERLEVLDVAEFLLTSDRIAALARVDGASVSRVLKKAERLAMSTPAAGSA
jgi:hypothetical protein